MITIDRSTEWRESDGLGGFASGTTAGVNTRRYHALLLAALSPPDDRHVLVNDAVVWLEAPRAMLQISAQRYAPGVPGMPSEPHARLVRFEREPWPIFTYELGEQRLTREVLVWHGLPLCLSRWRLDRPAPGSTLCVRPLLSGRSFRTLQQDHAGFDFGVTGGAERLLLPTHGRSAKVVSIAGAEYRHEPAWYRRVLYEEEQHRGLDAVEDLASPGVLRFDLSDPVADWIVALDTPAVAARVGHQPARVLASAMREREFRRRSALHSSSARPRSREAS